MLANPYQVCSNLCSCMRKSDRARAIAIGPIFRQSLAPMLRSERGTFREGWTVKFLPGLPAAAWHGRFGQRASLPWFPGQTLRS